MSEQTTGSDVVIFTCDKCNAPVGTTLCTDDGNICTVCLLARVKELEAVVETLPVTADGVPVVPGMKVYDKDLQGYDVVGLSARDDSSMPSDAYLTWRLCFATLTAAAEAAKDGAGT